MGKIQGLAKKTTLAILVFVILFGAVAAFFPRFNMEGFVKLVQSYTPLYATLILSIGTNSAVEKIQEGKKPEVTDSNDGDNA